jgi:hypothetical protein
VAVASIANREAHDAADREDITFGRVLRAAREHGLTLLDVCQASGLDKASVEHLLAEAD